MISTFVLLNWAAALPIMGQLSLDLLSGADLGLDLGLDMADHRLDQEENFNKVEAQSQPHAHLPSQKDELRPLEWGDLNFLHTTDTHGWLAGHILESEFSGDWGDFVSFTERMRQLADDKGVDLLVVDSGDRHDGNGLSDASKHDGSLSLPIFCEIDYDVVTVGNHELYRGVASLQEYHDIRKRFGDRYVVSNVEIAIGRTWIPMGHKYRVFETRNQHRKVLALGFLFDFTGNDKSASRVTPVADELEKPWFQNVLKDVLPSVDHVILVSHIPARDSPEFALILSKIREVNETMPVSMFAGHSHIRDYKIYDDYAVALQSGRYVETIGFASVNFSDPETPPVFSRSYIDFNARTMAFHVNEDHTIGTQASFSTERGKQVSKDIAAARKKLDLDRYLADVPQSYYTDRAPYPSERSIFSLFVDRILPRLTSPDEIKDTVRYIYLNTGAIRFDMFKGPYTKDTGYILSPFNNDWFYIPNVPKSVADQVLSYINGEERVTLAAKSRYRSDLSDFELEEEEEEEEEEIAHTASRGYVTRDDLGKDGDDTVHKAWKFHPIPNCVLSVVPPSLAQEDRGSENSKNNKNNQNSDNDDNDDDKVSLVFDSFLASFVEKALQQAGREELFAPLLHGGERPIDLIPQYLKELESHHEGDLP